MWTKSKEKTPIWRSTKSRQTLVSQKHYGENRSKIIRRQIFQTAQEFNGTFDDQAQERSIPNNLSTLVCMILDGLDLSIIQNEEQTGIDTINQAASTIS